MDRNIQVSSCTKVLWIFVMCPQKLILKTTWVYSDMGLHVPSKFFFNMQPNDPALHEQRTVALLRFLHPVHKDLSGD